MKNETKMIILKMVYKSKMSFIDKIMYIKKIIFV